jgi:tetratricopeptide (TPR) repeat protein
VRAVSAARLDQAAIHKGIDPETLTPALFAERRLAVYVRNGFKDDAVKLLFKADALERRGDAAAAEPLLVQATEIDPRLVEAQLRLSSRYETRDEHDKAIARYRKILEFQPLHVIALNNLAYDLAVYEKKPAEALGFAQRAYALQPLPSVLDTLGWVHHLSGDDRAAAPFIERAMAIDGKDVDILFHAAVVHEALNDRPRARAELDAAVKLDPKLAERADVKALRARLK